MEKPKKRDFFDYQWAIELIELINVLIKYVPNVIQTICYQKCGT